ncbi:RNA polymerase sigma factor [Pareuzebyella sediminis]|uniref:RNA polymerase sigma factor n=1 Tax=Pareuzebyella sediminis TaxID=2607998 RepID=UPI0011ECAFDD|nr:RNA polymerase sigma factor [Pareuzebyella sediminis]
MTAENNNYKNLSSFFSEEYRSLRAYVKSRIEDTADRDSEDILQDVAVKVFSRASSATPIDNIAGFVYHALRNRIIDLMRTTRKAYSLEHETDARLSEMVEQIYGVSDNTYSEKMSAQLRRAIDDLKPAYRDIIRAIDFEGYTYKEVSFETGVPEGTLMSRRHRAMALLLKALEIKKETI